MTKSEIINHKSEIRLPSLKTTVDAYGLMAKKSLGQNFLLDQNITDKIIRISLDKQGLKDFQNQTVTEIGPGPGGLTRAILKQNPKKLTVIEMDDRCISIMNDIKQIVKDQLHIINGDALKIEIPGGHIISNLPYNISVTLLINWLTNISKYQSLTLMFQKEVAERIMAPINTKDYGRLSILAQLQCKIDKLFDLNPECFTPAPKIWSTVLLFRPLSSLQLPSRACHPNLFFCHPDRSGGIQSGMNQSIDSVGFESEAISATLTLPQIQKLEKLTSMAFNQRRKMIRQSLKSIPNLDSLCHQIGIEPTYRPEQITPKQFLTLAELAF